MSDSNTFLYFAYGSNLLTKRIHYMNPSAVYKTNARLQDYKLTFDFESKRWKGAVATIQMEKGSSVWGIVWELNTEHLQSLDEQEGVSLQIYKPIIVEVETEDGRKIQCRTYQLLKLGSSDPRPSAVYKNVIINGAKENKLPKEYISKLEAIEDNGYCGDVDLNMELISQ